MSIYSNYVPSLELKVRVIWNIDIINIYSY